MPTRRCRRLRGLPFAALLLALPAGPGAVAAAPGFAGPYLGARLAQARNDFPAAARLFDTALARAEDPARLIEPAIVARAATGEMEAALELAGAQGADGRAARAMRLADAVRRGDFAALADRGVNTGISPAVDTLIDGWVAFGLGDMDAARAAFETASSDAPGLARRHLALALAAKGDFAAAESALAEAGGRGGTTRRAILARVQILSQLERNDEALTLLRQSFGPAFDPEITALVRRLESGETLPFTALATAADGVAELFLDFAGALGRDGPGAGAILYGRIALWLRPDLVDAALQLGQRLSDLGRTDLSLAVFRSVPRDAPAGYGARLGAAGALDSAGRTDEALDLLDDLAARHPDLQAVHVTTGDMLRRKERFEAAREAYDRAVALFGEPAEDQWRIYFARAICSERLGDWGRAEADFTRALELSPGRPEVLNYLGYSLVERREQLSKALDMIRTAVEARPEAGFIIDSLAWALYRLGRYDEAMPHMARAVEIETADPIVTDHYGDLLWAVGRRMEARFEWRRALGLEPETDLEQRIRRKLEVGLDTVLEEEGERPLDARAVQ